MTANNNTSDADRVYNLVLDLKRIRQEKKQAMRIFKEEQNRVEAEIEEIINRASGGQEETED